ncbi:MAG TPA: hypothetical protein PLV55_10305 [Anaerohalosphaeraceae bacterium]|nr:hypothetical protein [Anaerohalosphaeraceae bacterium]
MADCSQLSEKIVRLGMALAVKKNLQSFDDVVYELRQIFPEITREYVQDAFLETHARRKKVRTETEKILRSIYMTPIFEKRTRERAKQIEEYLETGKWPLPKKARRKTVSITLDELRKTRNALRRWLETSDAATRQKMERHIEELNRKLEENDIEPKKKGGYHEELQSLLDEIARLREEIKSRRIETRLAAEIEELQEHLERGTLPEKQAKKERVMTSAEREMRALIYDLKRQLRQSPPAVKKRLEEQIAALMERAANIEEYVKEKENKEIAEKDEEIERLNWRVHVLKREIRQRIRSLEPLTFRERIWRGADFIRLLWTSGEFSFLLRQGGAYFFTHPIEWARTVGKAAKAFVSEKALHDINKEIVDRPHAYLYKKLRLNLEGMPLSSMDEVLMNYWMDKIPVVKNFSQFSMAFMNLMRVNLFDYGYRTLSRTQMMTEDEADVWANYINTATGSGNLGRFEAATYLLNRTFFSPRYVLSRFQLLFGHPVWAMTDKDAAAARRLIIGEYIRLGMALTVFYMIAGLTGADIEEDPRSADFGKLRFGKARLDPLMGLSQTIRLISRMVSGKTKTISGQIRDMPADKALADFMRSKLSPQFSILMNILARQDFVGNEYNMLDAITRIYPITYEDIYDVMKENEFPENLSLSVLAFLGMGLQVYDKPQSAKKGVF